MGMACCVCQTIILSQSQPFMSKCWNVFISDGTLVCMSVFQQNLNYGGRKTTRLCDKWLEPRWFAFIVLGSSHPVVVVGLPRSDGTTRFPNMGVNSVLKTFKWKLNTQQLWPHNQANWNIAERRFLTLWWMDRKRKKRLMAQRSPAPEQRPVVASEVFYIFVCVVLLWSLCLMRCASVCVFCTKLAWWL